MAEKGASRNSRSWPDSGRHISTHSAVIRPPERSSDYPRSGLSAGSKMKQTEQNP